MDVHLQGLEVRYRPLVAWRSIVQPCILLGVVGASWWSGLFPTALVVVLAIVSVVLTVLLLVALVAFTLRAAKQPLALRLDADGVTFSGCPTVPWADVAAVEVGPWRPTPVLRSRRVVSFRPRPGVSATTLQPLGARRRLARRLHERRYGTSLVLPAFLTDVSAAEVAGAAVRLGGVRSVERPGGRGRKVLLGLLVGLAVIVLLLLALVLWYLAD